MPLVSKDLTQFIPEKVVQRQSEGSHSVDRRIKSKKNNAVWFVKKVENKQRAMIEVVAQEYFRFILPNHPKTRWAQHGRNFFVLSKEVEGFTYNPFYEKDFYSNSPRVYKNLGSVQVLALLLEEIDFKIGNVGIDVHHNVIKIDGGCCFANYRRNVNKQDPNPITSEHLMGLPALSNFQVYHWLDFIFYTCTKEDLEAFLVLYRHSHFPKKDFKKGVGCKEAAKEEKILLKIAQDMSACSDATFPKETTFKCLTNTVRFFRAGHTLEDLEMCYSQMRSRAEVKQSSELQSEINRTVLRLAILPHRVIRHFVRSYVDDAQVAERLSDILNCRRYQLVRAANGIPSFQNYIKSDAAQRDILDNIASLGGFKTMRKSNLFQVVEAENSSGPIAIEVYRTFIRSYEPVYTFDNEWNWKTRDTSTRSNKTAIPKKLLSKTDSLAYKEAAPKDHLTSERNSWTTIDHTLRESNHSVAILILREALKFYLENPDEERELKLRASISKASQLLDQESTLGKAVNQLKDVRSSIQPHFVGEKSGNEAIFYLFPPCQQTFFKADLSTSAPENDSRRFLEGHIPQF